MSSEGDNIADVARSLARSIQQQLEDALNDSAGLVKPILSLEGYIQEGADILTPSAPRKFVLGSLDLSSFRTPSTSDASTPPASRPGTAIQLSTRPLRKRKPPVQEHDSESESSAKRRKATGGLRIARAGQGENSTENSDRESSIRQLESGGRHFPQRKKNGPKNPQLQPSTLDRFIIGIFEQIHGPINLDPQVVMDQWPQAIEGSNNESTANNGSALASLGASTFSRVNLLCRKITHASRCCRSLEVIVQAHWIQCFDARVQALTLANPTASSAKSKKTALMEACEDFGWSEKDMRNKMAVWRGYYEIKEAAGWVALVFAGMGIYRFCKYRVSFDQEAMKRLRSLRHRFEVAADTIHPHWRDLLAFIGEPTERKYTGHQHDWVVSDHGEAIPLARTYLQWDPHFSFEHIDASIIDYEAWSLSDPRDLTWDMVPLPQVHHCAECGEVQSDDPKENCCRCFPNLYGGPHGPFPVQVFQTANGRNNGLIACCPFERGAAIGEFVGLVTTGLKDTDVMQGETNGTRYQIWQGKMGNYTRFVNHSCYPNSQFEKFVWRGVQRIVLVSRGIEAGGEITVDYSGRYWSNLDKVCLCGETCCRYRDRVLPVRRTELELTE